MTFTHKLSKRLAMLWAAALLPAAAILACGLDERTLVPSQPNLALTSPNTVSDLAVAATADSSVTLSFTEVDDGAGTPASYAVRFAPAPVSWGQASDVSQGTCAVPMAGTAIGATRSCTVLGLASATAYEFQLVAFTGTLNLDAVFSGLSNIAQGTTGGGASVPPPVPPADTLFAETFESGSLSQWQDGLNPSLHQVLTDASLAHSGNRVLEVTYPAGTDGGWLTHFLLPGYDSLFVSYWVRFPAGWQGGTKLIAFYGSRTDNVWSAFGQAGVCPNGTDFFGAMVTSRETGSPGPVNFYSYYPGMPSSGGICWGSFGNGLATYASSSGMSTGSWHQVEFWVKLNTPGQQNAEQTFWIDGVQRGSWNGLSFRNSAILNLNSVQLTFSNSETTQQTQKLYVDDVVVSPVKPGTQPPPPPPPPPPAPVASVSVSPVSASIDVGATLQVAAAVKDSSGNALTDRAVTWESSNTSVATVSGSGLVAAVAAGSATITATSEGISGTSAVSVTPPLANPSKVTNLAASGVQDTVMTLSFTEVSDGTGQPAKYEIRFAAGTITWGQATKVTLGSCAVPLAGLTIGAKRTCKVLGLNPSTAYQFQVVAFRGTLDVDAVFGPLSNIVSRTTKRKAVASVTVSPGSAALAAGASQQFTATLKDNRGNVLTGRSVTWASSSTGVATVSTGGLATTKAAGSATITATSETVKGTAAVSVTGTAITNPGTVTSLAVSGVNTSSVTLSFTEVSDGAGNPASYDVRYAPGTLSWGSASGVTLGTCSAPMAGTAIDAQRNCTVDGLASSVGYQFQLVAYRGTLNVDAVFGPLSNVASATTSGSAAPVASVTVSPSSSSLLIGGSRMLTATLKDASGNTLSGRAVGWSSSAPLTVSVGDGGLAAGLLEGDATIMATSEGQSGTAAVNVTAGGGTPGSNEPSTFRMLNDQAWNTLTGNGWNYLRRASSIDASIVSDATAPVSPSSMLRIAYSAGCCSDAEPSVHWMSVPGVQEIYTSWSMKLSPNWIPNPAGGGKITFLWTNGVGQVYTNLYHQGGTAETGWVQGAPYRIGLNTEWSPYGQRIWLPNVATTGVNPGEWHKIEVYYKWGTSGNGVIRWWVDGVLNGDYNNVIFPTSGTNFSQFEFAPTVQYAGSQDRFMYIDHTYVSIP